MVASTQLMLALTKGVVNVDVVSFLKPILKSWQLCLSFKLDVHRHPQLKGTHNIIDCIILIKSIIINKVNYNNSCMYVGI